MGREFLTNRDAKRAKAQAEALENAIWKPDFNKGQMLSSVLLLEKLNLLQLLTSGERLRGSDERMQELKAIALKHRFSIKNYLNVTISQKLTPVAFPVKGCRRHRTEITRQDWLAIVVCGAVGAEGEAGVCL
ncbi:hypothetical protein A6770_35890 [Nostoc minutum NIES-26]|uniref:Uncharacterized protein n=1 Tax=Nostoc minutum NIES-26 TaxID=1844469 RepID=A0A367RZ50_9NOSO|nr:hypothetical protein A6770_35890 [Nostoc minutum NIES-26]